MKIFLIAGGLFFIIFLGLIPLKRKFAEYNVQKNGYLITAIISSVPVCFGSKMHQFMYFRYKDKTYDKRIWCGFRHTHKSGDAIIFKHIEGTDIFLFENEKIEKEFASMTPLSLAGLLFIIIEFRKK